MKREKWDQAGKRKTVQFTDQHGRAWTAVKDVFTDTNIGPLYPSGWTPVKYQGRDLLPPDNMYRFNDSKPGTFVIDYDAWRQTLMGAHQQWAQQAGSYAAAMYGDKAMDALENPTPALLNMLGPKPMPIELVEAMQEGNKWILGLTEKKPKWAEEFFVEAPATVGGRKYSDDDEMETVPPRDRDGKGRFTKEDE